MRPRNVSIELADNGIKHSTIILNHSGGIIKVRRCHKHFVNSLKLARNVEIASKVTIAKIACLIHRNHLKVNIFTELPQTLDLIHFSHYTARVNDQDLIECEHAQIQQ